MQKRQWVEDPDDGDSWLIDGIYGDAPHANNVQVLILDDIGKEHRTATGWAENQFDAVLRARFNAGLPTIVTTNVPLKDWGSVYGEAMGSFAHEAFIPLVITAPEGDRRR
jgi:DNA replication protein DnaC